jgi:hypothetical protein
MSTLRRFLCSVFGHATRTDPRWAVVYHCERCGRLVEGGLRRWRT